MAKLIKIGKVWYSDLRMGGRRIQRALSRDRRIAEVKLAELVQAREANRHGHAPVNASWFSFRDKFLTTIEHKAPVTKQQYHRAIRHLEDSAALLRVSDVTPATLSDLWAKWKREGRGLYVRNRDMQSLKAMMRVAEGWGLVRPSKWGMVKLDKEPRGRLLWYSREEFDRLLGRCNGEWRTIAMLAGLAGLRRAEVYHLEWSDVDFERSRIHVSPKEGWNPKDFERRWVPMSRELAGYLKALPRPGPWVICDATGTRPTIGTMTTYFRRLSRQAGLRGAIHTLRHTFASWLASAGVSPFILKEILGHSKVEMTSRYMHLAPSASHDAVELLPTGGKSGGSLDGKNLPD